MNKRALLLGCAMAVPTALHAQNAIGEVYSGDANVRGSVILSGNGAKVLSGSQVSAGEGVALLRLERGGELRICPKTNLSLSADSSGRSLVVGMNAGAMELNYSLQTSQDSVLTPDFRFQLISPGTFHLAITVAPSGDTCVQSLPGDDASLFVAEMMGTDSYQLAPGKNVLFRGGRISGATEAPKSCGCPVTSQIPVLKAATPGGNTESAQRSPDPQPTSDAKPVVPEVELKQPSEIAADKPRGDGAEHLEVESQFAYRGSEVIEDYYTSVSRLSVSTDNSRLSLALIPQVNEPAVAKTETPEKKSGPLRRFGRFIGRLFSK